MNAKELAGQIVTAMYADFDRHIAPSTKAKDVALVENLLAPYALGMGLPARNDYSRIPPNTLAALEAWAQRAQTPGSFVEAILEHDLFQALQRADDDHYWILPLIVHYVYHKLPIGSHGSEETIRGWIEQGGLKGADEDDLGLGDV